MKMKQIVVTILTVLLFVGLVSMVPQQQKKAGPWEVPAKEKAMKNPVVADQTNITAGAALFKKHCASCHGADGKGNGVKARTLETFPGDFHSAAFQASTDGELFYRTKTGRGEMPSYQNKVSDQEIWQIMVYLRSLK